MRKREREKRIEDRKGVEGKLLSGDQSGLAYIGKRTPSLGYAEVARCQRFRFLAFPVKWNQRTQTHTHIS